MSAPEVDSVVSPATFTQVLSVQAGDFVILLRDQSSNPKFRLINAANVGGAVDYSDGGVVISTRTALNLVGGSYVLTDDGINEWANLQLGVQVSEDNVDLTLRDKINFLSPNFGIGATIADDAGNDRTNVQIHGTPYFVIDRTTGALPVVAGGGSNAICGGGDCTANGASSICFGNNSDADSDNSIVLGDGSGCINTSTDSIAWGNAAICDGALRAFQIGTGTNNNDDTLQFQSVTLGNNVSIEVTGNAGNPNGSVTARQQTLLVDTTTGTDLYINTDGATAWSLISGSGGAGTNTYVELTRTTNQTIATGSPGTVVQWENEVYDTDNLVDLGSSSTDIVIGTDGEYLIYFEFEWVADSTSFRETSILVNGSPVTVVRDDPPSAGNAQLAGSGLLLNLVATDVITLRVRQDTGGNLDLTGTQLVRLIQLTTSGGGGGAPAYTNSSSSSGVDVTLTPGVSDNRVFISPTVASINCILLTAGADNTTFFTIVNDDPGTGTIDVKIDLAGNPTQVTLDNAAPYINAAYDGSFYKFYA